MQLATPLLLHVEFNNELEKAHHVIGQIVGPLQRKMWKCGHAKRSIRFVVITEESSLELVQRLRLDQIDGIFDWTCHVAPIGAVSKHGGMSSLNTALDKAWEEVGKRHHPEYVRQTKRFDARIERRVKDRESGAIREMRIETPSMRQPPKNSDR